MHCSSSVVVFGYFCPETIRPCSAALPQLAMGLSWLSCISGFCFECIGQSHQRTRRPQILGGTYTGCDTNTLALLHWSHTYYGLFVFL